MQVYSMYDLWDMGTFIIKWRPKIIVKSVCFYITLDEGQADRQVWWGKWNDVSMTNGEKLRGLFRKSFQNFTTCFRWQSQAVSKTFLCLSRISNLLNLNLQYIKVSFLEDFFYIIVTFLLLYLWHFAEKYIFHCIGDNYINLFLVGQHLLFTGFFQSQFFFL